MALSRRTDLWAARLGFGWMVFGWSEALYRNEWKVGADAAVLFLFVATIQIALLVGLARGYRFVVRTLCALYLVRPVVFTVVHVAWPWAIVTGLSSGHRSPSSIYASSSIASRG